MTGRRWLALAAAAGAVALHVAHPFGLLGDATFLPTTAAAALGCFLSGRRGPSQLRAVRYLAAAGLFASFLGDLSFRIYEWTGREPDVSLADIPWFASYLGLGAALTVALCRRPGRGFRVDLHALLDVAAMGTVMVLAVWEFVIGPTVAPSAPSLFVGAVWAAYPVADAMLLALVANVLLSRRTREVIGWSVAAGAALWLASDLAFVVLGLTSGVIDAGWMVGALLLARPSRSSDPEAPAAVDDEPGLRASRAVAVLLPLLVPITFDYIGYVEGADPAPQPLVIATAVLVVVGCVRMLVLVRAEAAARRATASSRNYYERLASTSSDAFLVLDGTGVIQNESARLAALVGRPELSTAGLDILGLVVPDDRVALFLAIERAGDEPGRVVPVDISIRHADGQLVSLAARVVDLVADPDVGAIVVNLQDATDRRRAESELLHQALHDTLTGLPNRLLLRDRIEHALRRQEGAPDTTAVLWIDVDGFTAVNDTVGSDPGDELLREVGCRLAAVAGPSNTVARVGGDEFAVLLEDSELAERDALEIATRIRRTLAEPFAALGGTSGVTACIGIAIAGPTTTASRLVRDADLALSRARQQGLGRVVRFDERMRDDAAVRLRLAQDLGHALDHHELRLVYQPVVDLATEETVGFEALLRWQHPELGPVPPEVFVAIAEETGAIVPIGRWVLREACAAAAAWTRQATPLTVAVNISGRQLGTERLLADVAEALARAGLDPGALVLEITETAVVTDPDAAARALAELRSLGVRVAIDDFGIGYSSLSYLRELPLDILKVDRSFVATITATEVPAIVRGLLDLARTLGLEVVAEGVEDDVQFHYLRAEGCGFAQGYRFSRPIEAADVAAWIADERVAA